MNKVENINDCGWLYDYLDIHLKEGQELTSDAEDAMSGIIGSITTFDESDCCWYYKDMTDEEMGEVIDRYRKMLWDEEGNVRLKKWRVQITDRVDNQGCTNWLEFSNIIDAEDRYAQLVHGIEILEGNARFEMTVIDHEHGIRVEAVLFHS